ncbi:N-acetylglucosamine-1-phosphotransferase subunits alpha/beta [Harpegnathos saltator]|uniref:N-acetylglucosamine-1-phosphotransferase subunits alpha/beta n=1 Tax=Harpegnathos saltator TaxID=610380 RepID=E2BTE3_HARSA|nr:N-acetylglucosamine-1-phosphotransferase subunits alpha/beta [Harpegnathos saltator]
MTTAGGDFSKLEKLCASSLQPFTILPSSRKFICLNDDMDPSRHSENEISRALLNDFYRSLYPLRSTFELLAQYRNRFSQRHQLLEWKASRAKARNLLLCLVTLLLALTLYLVPSHHMRRLCRIQELPTLLV